MVIRIGWYETNRDLSINGILMKKGYQVYVPGMFVHENENLCHVKVRVSKEQEYMVMANRFVEDYTKVRD